MDAHTDRQFNPNLPHQSDTQALDPCHHSHARMHCPLGIILIRPRVTEIDQQSIAEVLGDPPPVRLNSLPSLLLVGTEDFPQVLGVELLSKSSGAHQIAEHD